MSLEATIEKNTAALYVLIDMLKANAAADAIIEKAQKSPKAQAAEAKITASSTPETNQPAEAAAPKSAPEAPQPEQPGAAGVNEQPTYEETAKAITDLAKAKGRDAAIAVLTIFGIAKLPEAKPEQFAGIIEECRKVGA